MRHNLGRNYHIPETVISWVTGATQKGKSLILVFQKIVTGTPGNEYEYSERDLEQIVRYASENAPNLTISEAMRLRPPMEGIYPLLLGDD